MVSHDRVDIEIPISKAEIKFHMESSGEKMPTVGKARETNERRFKIQKNVGPGNVRDRNRREEVIFTSNSCGLREMCNDELNLKILLQDE